MRGENFDISRAEKDQWEVQRVLREVGKKIHKFFDQRQYATYKETNDVIIALQAEFDKLTTDKLSTDEMLAIAHSDVEPGASVVKNVIIDGMPEEIRVKYVIPKHPQVQLWYTKIKGVEITPPQSA